MTAKCFIAEAKIISHKQFKGMKTYLGSQLQRVQSRVTWLQAFRKTIMVVDTCSRGCVSLHGERDRMFSTLC